MNYILCIGIGLIFSSISILVIVLLLQIISILSDIQHICNNECKSHFFVKIKDLTIKLLEVNLKMLEKKRYNR